MNRHILKISSALLSFSQRLINRITYRLPTNYQQLANVQFKKISIPTPKKVNVNSKGERVSKSQNFRRRTNPKMHYIVNIADGKQSAYPGCQRSSRSPVVRSIRASSAGLQDHFATRLCGFVTQFCHPQ